MRCGYGLTGRARSGWTTSGSNETHGDLVWRVGGRHIDASFGGDPLTASAAKHDGRLLPDGHLRLVDNRTELPPSSPLRW